jgi:predicted nucleic acid-binding protein
MNSDKVVFDASVSAKWVIVERDSDKAHALLNASVANTVTISVPPLWGYELDSIIRYRVSRGDMSDEDADIAYAFIDGIPLEVQQLNGVRRRAREIAAQANQRRVYDSIYAAHAEAEQCTLWTADHAYFKAVRGFLPYVHFLGDA